MNEPRGLAAQRAAETLLNTLGGSDVTLLLKDREVSLFPVLVRSMRSGNYELLIAASTLEREISVTTSEEAIQMFKESLGFDMKEKNLRINSVDVDDFCGMPYLYRLNCQAKGEKNG